MDENMEKNEEVVEGSTNAQVEGAVPEQTDPVNQANETEVDDRGVPLKNVVAELQRKLDEASERLSRFEAARYQQPEVPQTSTRKKSREEILAEINQDPEGYFERKVEEKLRAREEQQLKVEAQKKFQEADKLVYDKDPNKYRENAIQVAGIIKKYNINMANPVDGVKAALDIYEQQQKLNSMVSKSLKKQTQDSDVVRTTEIKKTQPVPGNKATPQVSKQSVSADVYRKQATESGAEKDVYNFFRNTIFNDDKKK